MPSDEQQLRVEINGDTVRAALSVPDSALGGAPLPAVLLCRDFTMPTNSSATLSGEFLAALLGAGVAVARFEPRRKEKAAPASATDFVDDASAVFRQLLLHDGLDADRIGVLGVGIGAIAAACLAGRTDHVNRLCLLSPISAADLMRTNGAPQPAVAEKLDEAFLESLVELTPIDDIANYDRPTLIVQGAADRIAPPESAQPYVDSLRRAGHSVSHELIALGNHEFTGAEARSVCLARIAGFFGAMTAAPVAGVRA